MKVVKRQTGRCGGPPRPGRRALGWASAATAVVVLSACGQATTSGDLATATQLAHDCHDKPVAAMVAVDVSGSMASPTFSQERARMVMDAAEQTAVCGGHLRVLAFSTSSARTGVLYDGQLTPTGATETARLRRSLKQAVAVVDEVEKNYQGTPGQLSPDGSDILGTYLLAGQYFTQLGDRYGTKVFMLDTDGFATDGVRIPGQAMDPDDAKALADKADVPALPGVTVTVAGLGKENGTPPDTAVVQGLTSFYDAVCAKTRAASCTSVTDYVGGQK